MQWQCPPSIKVLFASRGTVSPATLGRMLLFYFLAAVAQVGLRVECPDLHDLRAVTIIDPLVPEARQYEPILPGTLFHAVFRADVEEVAERLQRDTSPHLVQRLDECEGVWGNTPILLTVNADPHGTGAPRSAALQERFDQIAELLLEAGADVDGRDLLGQTLEEEVWQLYPELLGGTALSAASSMGRASTVKLLLRHDAEADVRDILGETALHKATRSGQLEIVRLLIAHGADVTRRNKEGVTVLLESAWAGHAALVTELLASNASAQDANDSGESALIGAASAGHADVVRLLLDHGALPDVPNNDGLTPLRAAATGKGSLGGRIEVVQELLARGIDLAARHRDGMTALQAAQDLGEAQAARLIRAEIERRRATPTRTAATNTKAEL